MSTADDVLRGIRTLAGPDGRYGYPTAREIAAHLGIPTPTVSAALRRLETSGQVQKMGAAFDGGRTWAPVDDQSDKEN